MMLIISYFLTFVLVISLIFILLSYFNSFISPKAQHKPLGSKGKESHEEFAEEFFPSHSTHGNDPIEYNWKGSLTKGTSVMDLPSSYADERLVLLIKNPFCLYAYWETSHTWKEDTPVLRVYEVTPSDFGDEFTHLFDLEILREAKNWFINVPKDNCSYFVELGGRTLDGRFVPILHSLVITTPRSSLSAMIDENWIPCNVYEHLGDISYGLSSGSLAKE